MKTWRAVLLVAVLGCSLTASAQSFPSRPITLYVPFVPGPTDAMARKFAEIASRQLGQPIVNRLHEAFSKAFEDPETLRVLDSLKKDPWPMTPAAYSGWAQEAVRQERTMVERAGLLMK